MNSKRQFKRSIKGLLGFSPRNLKLYETALTHSSAREVTGEDNERLELLGDSVLDLIVTEYLFNKFPFRGEGKLTELRSKMVSRRQLKSVARKIGLENYMRYNLSSATLHKSSALGNAFEALVGAIYMDRGVKTTRKWLMKRVIQLHYDIDKLDEEVINFKSLILHHIQKNNHKLDFKLTDTKVTNSGKKFVVSLFVDGEEMGQGEGYNKKTAEQIASQQACGRLGLVGS